MTLTEFLLARIAEDEAMAKAATPGPWERSTHYGYKVVAQSGYPTVVHVADGSAIRSSGVAESGNAANTSHIVSWNPARVLAECEAKRRLVELHTGAASVAAMLESVSDDLARAIAQSCLATVDGVLKIHAAVHAGHPDYRDEWRP